ncbi:hybrid sensor histidine kinase/response regulator [Methylobacterium iners]|uniref:histidine kinase n=1 Tax=Methylobacterium iners TaxID=418707 RepID=A0ABQ4RWK2_9HYPH|nr:PAS domain-containing sensor histidine kinase [Methylobacterium iners]GJD94053.1 Sensor histidine kinase RcsC [Methylobacterium iners]
MTAPLSSGGGASGALIRGRDWSETSLGPTETWPQALRLLTDVMLDANQPMFIAWGADLVLLYNDPYAEILGKKHPAAMGGRFFDVWHEIRRDLEPIVAQALSGQSVHMADLTLVMERKGYPEETHFSFSYTPVRDGAGGVGGFFCACAEITGQVMAERRLRESEERLRLVLETATDHVIFTTDTNGVVTSWSAGAEAVLGWRAETAKGRSASMIFTPEDRAAGADRQELATAARNGCANDERWHLRADGTRVFLDGSMHALPDGQGFIKIARDETLRRQQAEALAESEARFRNMADHAPVMMWVTDPSGSCTYLNRSWYEFTGQTEAEALGMGWTKATHPDDEALAAETFLSANARQAPFRVEYRLRRADGAYRLAIDAASPRFGPGGEFLGYVGSVIDIDERREAEERLRESETRARELAAQQTATLGQLAEGVIVTDAEGRVTLVNEAAARIHGVRRLDVAPEDYAETYHLLTEDGRPYPTDDLALTRAVRGEVVLDARWRIRHPDGTQIVAVGNARPVRDGAGTQIGAVLTLRDETARVAAEAALRELNETLEARVEERTHERDRAWKNSRDLQIVVDMEGVFRAANEAWTTILGWPPEDMVGRSFLDFIHPEDHHSSRDALATASVEELPTYENRYRHKDGSYRWISWVAAPEEGLIYASGRHVTAEREAAATLAATQEALRQSQKMEAVGQLTGGIAHDFNNLLAGISGSLELLQTRMAQGRMTDLDRYLNAAQGAAKRAAALTHRLLAFSRRQTLDPKSINVNALIMGMDDLIRRTVGPSIAVEVVGATGLWPALVDPPQLENALLNLCINARDAMPDGGRITIETANKWMDERGARERDLPPGQYLSLCVTDTGTGMSPEVAARAFDPFFTTKLIGKGTGLGLSMIYGFARQSGGQVRIYTEEGQGTTMCIYLPRHYGAEAGAMPDADLSAAPRAEQGQTVLVVDDEPTVRMLVTEVLEELGYTAIEAADGTAGLKVLQSDVRIDLLVTDVGLPGGMNGRQMADAGRVARPKLKVLFITGYAENAVIGNGHLEPGMQVLTKPFVMEALASRIKDLIAYG